MQNSLDDLHNLSSTSPFNATTPDHSPPNSLLRQRKSTFNEKPRLRQRHDSASQAAKREVLTNLRDDWIWPLPPSHDPIPLRVTPSTQWCERFSDSSSLSPSPPPSNPLLEPPNPYKYDNPESISHPFITRKRKRHQRLKKEMNWNEGLAIYTQRRDSWAGVCTSQSKSQNSVFTPLANSFSSTPDTSAPNAARSTTCRSASNSPPPLLPLSPPLILTSNPIRASITPAAYPAIYSKVIVQGLTPTVPINLSDVVKALVQGWKENEEWPPRPEGETRLEGQETQESKKGGDVVGKSGILARKGVGRMKRVLGLRERQDDDGI